jgi:predicted N-acetyltransferase YhbS
MAPHPAGPGLALLQPSKYNTYLSFVAEDVAEDVTVVVVTAVFCGEKKEFIIEKQDEPDK